MRGAAIISWKLSSTSLTGWVRLSWFLISKTTRCTLIFTETSTTPTHSHERNFPDYRALMRQYSSGVKKAGEKTYQRLSACMSNIKADLQAAVFWWLCFHKVIKWTLKPLVRDASGAFLCGICTKIGATCGKNVKIGPNITFIWVILSTKPQPYVRGHKIGGGKRWVREYVITDEKKVWNEGG